MQAKLQGIFFNMVVKFYPEKEFWLAKNEQFSISSEIDDFKIGHSGLIISENSFSE